jgi:hypothetical protein
MEDILDSLAQTSPVDLRDLVEERALPSLPDSTVKHNAATVAMLSDNPLQSYNSIMAEQQQGVTYTKDDIVKRKVAKVEPEIKMGLMSLLSDPSVPLDQKQKAIQGISTDYHKEPMVLMANDNYASPVLGESHEQEMVRVSGAELFGGYRELAQEQNKILNSRKLEASGAVAADLATQLLPFSTNVQTVELLSKAAKEAGVDVSKMKMALAPGSSIEQVVKALDNIPPQQKIAILNIIDNIIKDNHSLVFDGNNTLSAITQARALIAGDYSTFDKWVDNASGVLDAIGLGIINKGISKSAQVVTKLFSRTPSAESSKATQKIIADSPSPVSVLKVQGETNPDKARGTYTLIVKSQGDEAAQALAGTSREGAIVDAHVPQPKKADGSIEAKVQKPDAILNRIDPEADITNAWRDALGKGFNEEEAALAIVNTTNKLKDVTGISLLDNLVSVGERGGKQIISAVYGSDKGGFAKAEHAFKQAQYALREFGVKPEDLTLLKKIDGEYVPITLAETKGKFGNYAVKLDLEKPIELSDVGKLTEYDVKRNWFDRIMSFRSEKQGTVANHILDHASMLHKNLTATAIVQSDKASSVEKILLQQFERFSTPYGKLDKNQQAIVFDTIQEANKLGKEFTVAEMHAKGMGSEAIQSMEAWRKAWDQMYWLENGIKGKQLSHNGFQVIDNGVDKYFVKPVAKNQNITKAYDSVTDTVVTLSKTDQDALYNAGGTLSRFVRPHTVNGVEVEHMVVHNSPTHYSRAIRESDQVLDYRPGYYQVQYKAPKYIVRTVDAGGGRTYEKAVAVAGDTGEAMHVAERYAIDNGISPDLLRVRSDVKDLQSVADFTWDLEHASGRIAQRRRGKRLEGASDNITTAFEKQHILDPVESATRASMSLANKVAMGDALEAMKARAVQQYGEFMKEVEGMKQWPSSSNMLKSNVSGNASKLADARTTVEYINYLTRGYENALDMKVKGMLKAMAQTAAEHGAYATERGLETLAKVNPTQAAKSTVFGLMISAAPFRQWFVQTHGTIRLAAYDAEALLRSAPDIQAFLAYKGMGVQSKAGMELDAFFSRSGLLDAIDKHSLIRGAVHDISMADKPIAKGLQKAVEIPRKLGFDKAEQMNSLVHAAVVRQRYLQKGMDVTDPKVMDQIHAEARAIMGDMNFAGDMPYNQNWAGLFMQFLQYPHKMIMSVTTNRRISTADKIKLVTMDAALFGIPGYALLEKFAPKDSLPQDSSVKHVLQSGLEDWAFNKLLSDAAGTKVNVDFSALSPYEADGFKKFADSVTTTGFSGLMKMAPIMSIVGPNGKLPEAANRVLRFAGLKETYDGMPVEDYVSVFQGFADMASGWSAGKRAYLAYEAGKLKDKDGMTVVENYTAYNAILTALGFRNKEEFMQFKTTQEIHEAEKTVDADIRQTVQEHIRILSRDQKAGVHDPEKVGVILNVFNKMYADNPKALERANTFIAKELANNKDKMLKGIVESSLNPNVYSRLTEIQKLHQVDDAEINKALNLAKKLDEEIRNQQKEKGK